MKSTPDKPAPSPDAGRSFPWVKLALFIGIAGIATGLYILFGEHLTLENLARQESQLRQFQSGHPLLVYGIAFLVYVLVTGLSLPGATGLTLVYGWYFGFWQGLPLISFASTTGATLAFVMSRFFLRDFVQRRFGEQLTSINRELEKEGAFYLFTLRLIPAVPFFVINLVMGLTPVRTRTYWWVSQLGMLPGTCVYIYAGSAVPDLQTLADKGVGAVISPERLIPLIIAFALIGVFPLAVRKIMQRLQSEKK